MIEHEVAKILKDESQSDTRLAELADSFREGRNPQELLTLLGSRDAELVATGAWILDEISSSLYDDDTFLHPLKVLLMHESDMVRFYAIGALYPIADNEVREIFHSLAERDENVGVRNKALAAVTQETN